MNPCLRSILVGGCLLAAACGDSPVPAPPAEPAAPSFTGSDGCRNCHETQFADWRGSHHDLAMQEVSEASVIGDFDEAVFDYFGEETRFFRRDGAFLVRTAGADGKPRDFEIAYVFGVEPLQQYLVRFPDGRLQTLPFAWDSRESGDGGQRWFHVYGDDYIGSDDPLHWTGREQNWNYMCAECHSTNLDVGYDPGADTFATSWSEIDVGCEACHGPGSAHSVQAALGDFDSGHGFPVNLNDQGRAVWQMNPATGVATRSELAMRPPQQPESCGRCHARRGLLAADYEYGKPLTHTHAPSLLADRLYFPDGQILDEVYVYGSFLQSRMYSAGVTCSDCHDPHSLQLVAGAEPSDVCSRCHLPMRFDTAEHHGHDTGDVACVDCHMASRIYMQVDARRDHSFRVPRPDLTLTTGSPNACKTCHGDKDAGWAVEAARRWWGERLETRPEFATALSAGRQGHANPALREVIGMPSTPGIARATALTLLRTPFGEQDLRMIESALRDADPLVRIGALRAMRGQSAERLVPFASLLEDSVRGVRVEAAMTLAPARDWLPVQLAGAFDAAAREFAKAQEAIASRPEAHANLGDFAAAGGDFGQAIVHFERALKMEPAFTLARVNMADALRRAGDEERSESVLRQGIALDADDAALRHSLGLLLVRVQRTQEGVDELRNAAELEPGNSRYAYVLGVALNSTDRFEDAIRVLRDAQLNFPGDFDLAWALATILRDRDRLDEAMRVAEELHKRYPDNRNVAALREALNESQ